jgi:quercetin dioxygenase-like cupin family protein
MIRPSDNPLAKRVQELEREGYTVDPWIVPAGASFRAQVSNEDKVLAVLKGRLHLELPHGAQMLTSGSVVSIEHGVSHSLRVDGEDDVYAMVAHREPPPIPPEAFEAARDRPRS